MSCVPLARGVQWSAAKPTVSSQLSALYLLFTTHYSLLTTHYSLLTAHCSLLTTCSLLDSGVGGDTYRFKSGYNSEVEVTAIVEREGSCIGYKSKEDLIYGLRTLVNNVVLLRDDERPNDAFYPRIEMWKTSSFQVRAR